MQRYSIPAIPTMYRGIQFRSRLEARWAAFFDVLGWHWEYEPAEFRGWIPDFLLFGQSREGPEPVYVEVKPLIALDWALTEELDRSGCTDEILIVGQTILHDDAQGFRSDGRYVGWLGEASEDMDDKSHWWERAPFGIWEPQDGKPQCFGFCHESGSFHDRITGKYDGGCWGGLGYDSQDIDRLWAQATNETQWKYFR